VIITVQAPMRAHDRDIDAVLPSGSIQSLYHEPVGAELLLVGRQQPCDPPPRGNQLPFSTILQDFPAVCSSSIKRMLVLGSTAPEPHNRRGFWREV